MGQYDGGAFVTGQIARLALDSGVLEWTNAGHPRPLLLRGHRVVRELRCEPSLPFGFGGQCEEVASEALEPGDSVLFFTDGVVEGRSEAGSAFGEALGRPMGAAVGLRPADGEILRRLVTAILDYSGGKLRDDATLLVLHWSGTRP